jgi:hypothetical protein
MTSTVTQATRAFVELGWASRSFAGVMLIVLVLLMIVLTEKELLRAWRGQESERGMRALDIGVVPIVCAFFMIAVERLLDVLSP